MATRGRIPKRPVGVEPPPNPNNPHDEYKEMLAKDMEKFNKSRGRVSKRPSPSASISDSYGDESMEPIIRLLPPSPPPPAHVVELMLGGKDIVEAKLVILEVLSRGPSTHTAARKAGITHDDLIIWLREDDAFLQLSYEAKGLTIEGMEMVLIGKAMDGCKTCILAFLNSKHEEYGILRAQMLMAVLNPVAKDIVAIAQRYIHDQSDLESFAHEIGNRIERAALEGAAAAGPKRR